MSSPNNITPAFDYRIDQTPTVDIWSFIPLYKNSIEEDMLSWQITYDASKNPNILLIIEEDGDEIITNSTKEVTPDTALAIARQEYKLKYKDGYRPGGSSFSKSFKGMSPADYNPKSIKSWPVLVQPKLHGIRMFCNDGIGKEHVVMRSSLGNQYKHLTHLESDLKEFFEYLPLNATLDGELYNHDLSHEEISSAIKTVTSRHPNLSKITYWISDIDYEDPYRQPSYEDRYALLINAYAKFVEDCKRESSVFTILQADSVNTHEEIEDTYENYISSGYNGLIVKKLANNAEKGLVYKQSLYKSGKNSNTLKYQKKAK